MIRIGIRELFIWKVIIASILVVLSTEIFSIFDAINGTNIKLFWTVVLLIFIAGVFYLYKIIAIYLNSLEIKKYGLLKPFLFKKYNKKYFNLVSGQARYWAFRLNNKRIKKIKGLLIE